MTSLSMQASQESQTSKFSEKALVSIIVLNWNGKHVIQDCLNSLLVQTYAPLEIMVVDNGSKDGSVEFLKQNFPKVRLVVNEKNLGFCGGNNVGIRSAQGSFIALVNNDAVLEPRFIEESMKTIEKAKDIGVVASKIILSEDHSRIDAAGIAICPDGLSIGRGRMESEKKYDEEAEVFFASDCACLYRKEMLDDIGIYDDDFFAYAEETDMGWRAQLRGWRCVYNPKAIAIHRHSSSLGQYSPFKVFLVERNRIWVAIKNIPLRYFPEAATYTFLRYFYQALGAFSGRGAAGEFAKSLSKWQLAWILIKAHLSAFFGIPKMLKKRKEIQKTKKISSSEVRNLLLRFGISAKGIAFKC